MHKTPVHEICAALGDEAIAERLGVTPRAVRGARDRRRFSPYWYVEMKRMCAEAGVDCPDSAFNFIQAHDASSQDAA